MQRLRRTSGAPVRGALRAAVAVLVVGCGGSSSPSPTPATPTPGLPTPGPTASSTPGRTPAPTTAGTPVPTAPGCAAVPGGSPTGTLAADYPVALAIAPDGRLFYAERGGSVRVVEAGVAHLFATVSTVTAEPDGGYSERGLLGLAVSPRFASDHFVYAMYSTADYAHTDVVRWTDCGGTGQAMRTLAEYPAGSDCCHKGGRLAFGPDGRLYVTLGEEHAAAAAQNVGDVRGKVLRYNADFSVPSDNPFGATNPVWAYGLRNPFGIAVSSSGTVMVTNNGPSGDAGSPSTGFDTVDTIVRGAGYQWPYCYGYSHPISGGGGCNGEMGPDWSSEADIGGSDTAVPTGATFVDAAGPAPYAGHFVFCTYARGMRVLTPGSPHASVGAGPAECMLDVKEGPGGTLFYSDTGHIYRVG